MSERVVVEVTAFEALVADEPGSRRALVRWSDGSAGEALRWYDDLSGPSHKSSYADSGVMPRRLPAVAARAAKTYAKHRHNSGAARWPPHLRCQVATRATMRSVSRERDLGQTPEGYEWCRHCNGYGSSLKDENERCARCNGTGLVAADRASQADSAPKNGKLDQ